MLFSFAGSSGQIPTWPVIEPHTESPVAFDPLSEWTFDEPLPAPPPVDEIRLFVQSPFKLFLYWDFARDPHETLMRSLLSGPDYRLIVRLIDTTSGETILHEAANQREQFFAVLPGRAYQAEVGFFAMNRPFIRLLQSNATQTPRSGVAHMTGRDNFDVSAEDFTRVLDESGFPSDALEVALEAADEKMRESFTRIVAQTLTGADASLFDDDELIELRRFLSAVAFGAPVEGLQAMFSRKVSGWFEQSFDYLSSRSEAARLVEILHYAFGLEISAANDKEIAGRQPGRALLGASDVRLPGGRPAHLWLPSMTGGLAHTRLSELQRIFPV